MVDISRMIVGVDIAKRVFQLYWVEKDTGEEMNVRLSRAKFLNHFANRAPCLVAMEACGGSQHWARRLLSYGHEVRILPAKMVRGFVRGNKNDAHDARAIWIAVQQPGVRTVAVKTEEQQAVLALHRMRQQLVKFRTAQINGLRGLLAEYGEVMPKGRAGLKRDLPGALGRVSERLPGMATETLREQWARVLQLDEEIARIERRLCEDTAEVRLNCYSEERAHKERAMVQRLCARYEAALTKLAEGLSKPRARRKPEQIHERIGRLKAKHRRVAGYYKLDLTVEGDRVASVAFTRNPARGSMADLPGVYCLRTNLMDWDAERLWKTYVTLTNLEAVFRCLKSELGLRPIHHRAPRRTEGHLFIAVLAYQLVQIVRRRLRENGHTESWTALRNRLAPRCRVTATFRCADGRTLHLRKATALEPHQKPIYDALGIHPDAGGFVKKVI